jgi:hypothetical protein
MEVLELVQNRQPWKPFIEEEEFQEVPQEVPRSSSLKKQKTMSEQGIIIQPTPLQQYISKLFHFTTST